MGARALLGASVALGTGVLLAMGWLGGGPSTPEPADRSADRRVLTLSPSAALAVPATAARPQGALQTVDLLEVGRSRNGREVAWLRVGGGAPQRFGVGDVVGSGVRVVRILPHVVELQRGAVLERVLADAQTLAPHSRAAPLRYGADAATDLKPAVAEVVVSAMDLPPPNSTAIERAIARTRAP